MKIDLLWIAVIAELKFIKSSAETETVRMIEIVEAIMMILVFKEWLLEAVTVLNLTGTALATAMIWDWQCLNCCNSLSVSVKI